MSTSCIVIEYYDRQIIATIDINSVIETLIDTCGECFRLTFRPMSEAARKNASDVVDGMCAIRERFHIFQEIPGRDLSRREDIELLAVKRGQK